MIEICTQQWKTAVLVHFAPSTMKASSPLSLGRAAQSQLTSLQLDDLISHATEKWTQALLRVINCTRAPLCMWILMQSQMSEEHSSVASEQTSTYLLVLEERRAVPVDDMPDTVHWFEIILSTWFSSSLEGRSWHVTSALLCLLIKQFYL